jgi:hypothetical protein
MSVLFSKNISGYRKTMSSSADRSEVPVAAALSQHPHQATSVDALSDLERKLYLSALEKKIRKWIVEDKLDTHSRTKQYQIWRAEWMAKHYNKKQHNAKFAVSKQQHSAKYTRDEIKGGTRKSKRRHNRKTRRRKN